MGVCERYDSMGVRERAKKTAVDPSPLLWASSRQFKVEGVNMQRAKRRDTECAEVRGKKNGCGFGGKGGECPSRIRVKAKPFDAPFISQGKRGKHKKW